MPSINISFNPGFSDWLKQSQVFRFIFTGMNRKMNDSGMIIPDGFFSECSTVQLDHKTGKTALITGATSGIGKEFAYNFASRGYDLIITGRRKHEISVVAYDLRKIYHVQVDVIIADLSSGNDLKRLLKFIEKKENIEILVNNAGYGLSEGFIEDQINNQLKMLKVHVTAPLLIIHKVLPQMIRQRRGSIINVTSLAAYAPNSKNAMYTSTKCFLTNFTESLYMDLNRFGIHVQCLCPGFARTDFHKKLTIKNGLANHSFINWMHPSEVVRCSLHCLETGKILCIPGVANRIMAGIISILPRRFYYYLMGIFVPKDERQNRFMLSKLQPLNLSHSESD